MRNHERIRPIMREIAQIWAKYPDMRLGQLLVNATQRPETGLGSLFYIEDDELLDALRAFASMYSGASEPSAGGDTPT